MNNVLNERKIAMRRYIEGEKPVEIYTSLGRSAVWFFKWKKRYQRYGLDGLKDLTRTPPQVTNKISEALESAIVNIRKLRERRDTAGTKYALIGALAIQKELQELGYAPPSVRTVHRVLGRHNLITPKPPEQSPREVIDRHYPSFQITRPGELQQLDLIGPRYSETTPSL